METATPPGGFKSQPWVLFDTLAASRFNLGSATPAIGGSQPVISSSGEMVFFQSAGRTKATMPWYTNIDQPGQLAYGMEVWQIYLRIMFPSKPPIQSLDDGEDDANAGPPPPVKLAEAILNYGVLELNLGQEEQTVWPLLAFGGGGGLSVNSGVGLCVAQNSNPDSYNVMKLPEPIQMERTQNLSAKIRLANEVFNIIGTDAAPGVGSPLEPYVLTTESGEAPITVSLTQPPYSIQLGLVGRRVKKTQYGQVPNAAGI
jgi:hypothetical protein